MAAPSDHVRSVEEIGRVLADDARFAPYRLVARGADTVELHSDDGDLVIARAALCRDPTHFELLLARASSGTILVLAGEDGEITELESLAARADLGVLALPISRARLYIALKGHLDLVTVRAQARERGRLAERYRYELGELVANARAISSERDIDKLLGVILERSRYITGADAGSVYIIEGQAPELRQRKLRFMVSQNDSVTIDLRKFTLPIDENSIVGRAVLSRAVINISDLLDLGAPGKNPMSLVHDGSVDRRTGYQARSMLTVPLVNQRDEVIGVIQLINKRRDGAPRLRTHWDFDHWVIPFDERAEELAATLASQAGISLENTLLYADIQQLFDGFVNASVTAIESRDPTTSGHSLRVATLTVGLARMVDRESAGPYADLRFGADDLKQIEYAGLLHDFGKVGVRESVLVKAKKLHEWDRNAILARFDYLRKSIEAELFRSKLRVATELEGRARLDAIAEQELMAARRLAEIEEYERVVLQANEPSVLPGDVDERLSEIAARTFTDPRGVVRSFLDPAELAALRLAKGSLTAEERREIESHVVHTFNFLETIPWGRRFGRIPAIAGAHHEKLDGSGYPHGLRAEEIRVEARMMAIADIYDALTASDRPYKKSLPVERALAILESEVRAGRCDTELFRIFVDAQVYRLVITS